MNLKETSANSLTMREKITAVDLFAGAGGFSLAALNSGIDVLGAIELDKTACDSYVNNIVLTASPHTKVLNENIFEVDAKKFRESIGLGKNELDILLGGPPCQGFSSHRINDAGVEDPRNKLLIRYFDFVKELGPKIFLVENVPGLLWERHEEYLNKFVALARRHGYRVLKPVKLNAKNFGVPQNRDRVFILGIKSDLGTKGLNWPPEATHFKPGKNKPSWITASSVFPSPPEWVLVKLREMLGEKVVDELKFNDKVNLDENDNSAISMRHGQELISRFESTPINGGRLDADFRLPCHEKEYDGHKDVYGRIRLAQPGPTITTGCFNPSRGRFLHPWLNHGISLRYAARLQTFPDSFIFSGGITSQGKQIGNAVPVKLGESLLMELKRYLDSFR